MVFSANAVESGTNNFAAFEARAVAQNGTGSSTSNTAGQTDGASTRTFGRFVALVVAGSIVALLL